MLGKHVNVPEATSPEDHLVTDLPLLDDNDKTTTTPSFPTKHWAGLLPASQDGDKYLFYWLFEPDLSSINANNYIDNIQDHDIPLLIWLNGGPACSSMDGLWLENGPFRLKKDIQRPGQPWHIEIDENSWHTAPAYVLYIDQPVGTGISFTTSGKYPTNDEEVNVDFYYFLKQFLHLHSDKFLKPQETNDTDDENDTQSNNQNQRKWTMQRPLYFSGESHAGHYIPSMMNYIQQQNKKNSNNDIYIPVSGGAIGNGWVDPIYQYSAQDAAYGYGMIGKAQQRALALKEKTCRQALREGKYRSNICFELLDEVLENSQGKNSKYIASQYDQRKWEIKNKPRDFPPGHRDVEAYLGGHGPTIPGNFDFKQVLEAIHASPSLQAGQTYYECTDPPYNALKHNDGLGVVPDVVDLLNNDVRLLFFNGIHDLICNHVGNENAVENFPWKFRDAYQTATRYGWKAPSTQKLGGYMKEHKNLQFLKVLDSGHMVPLDVPEISLDMIRAFMYQQSFQSYQQEIVAISQSASNPSCPICPTCNHGDEETPATDCQQVCQEMAQKSASSSSSLHLSGMAMGVVAFLAMVVVWSVCRRFLCTRRLLGKITTTNTKNNSTHHHILTRSSPQNSFDVELTNHHNHNGGFRDDVDEGEYTDDQPSSKNNNIRPID